jgi:NAD(P)H dehydrogenase (quinone)
MAKLAVTGCTGELGGRVARRLAERGVEQRLIVRDAANAPDLDSAEVATATSYEALDEYREALAGIETVYLVSAHEQADRAEMQRALVGAIAEAGVKRIVYVSFINASEDATFIYARHHWATEQAIREAGVTFTFLRSSPYLDFIPVFAGEDWVLRGPGGEGRFAPVSRDDLADSAVAVLTSDGAHDGETHEMTGPDLMTWAEVAQRLGAYLGREVPYVDETLEEAWESRRASGMTDDWLIEGGISSWLAVADGSFDVRTDAVEKLSGHPPQTLEQTLDAHPELTGS